MCLVGASENHNNGISFFTSWFPFFETMFYGRMQFLTPTLLVASYDTQGYGVPVPVLNWGTHRQPEHTLALGSPYNKLITVSLN